MVKMSLDDVLSQAIIMLSESSGERFEFAMTNGPDRGLTLVKVDKNHIPGPKGTPKRPIQGRFTEKQMVDFLKHIDNFTSMEEAAKAIINICIRGEHNMPVMSGTLQAEINARVAEAIAKTKAEMIEWMTSQGVGNGSPVPPTLPVERSLSEVPVVPRMEQEPEPKVERKAEKAKPWADKKPKSYDPKECRDVIKFCEENNIKVKTTPRGGKIPIWFVLQIRKQMKESVTA